MKLSKEKILAGFNNEDNEVFDYIYESTYWIVSNFVLPSHQRHKIVKTGNISNGIYFCYFMIGDELIENFKLEIIRK